MFFTETLIRPDPRCTVVQDNAQLGEWERCLKDCARRGLISYDTETSGFDWFGSSTRWRTGPAAIIGHCFGYDLGDGNGPRGVYFPVGHGTVDRQLDHAAVTSVVQNVLGDPDTQVVMQNAKFDMHFAEAAGITIRAFVHDTFVMSALDDENQKRDLETLLVTYGIDAQAHDKKDAVKSVFRDLCRRAGIKQSEAPGYAWIPVGVLGPYGAFDGLGTLALGQKLLPKIRDGWWSLYGTEARLLRVLQKAEHVGMQIDVEYLLGLHTKVCAERDQLVGEIQRLVGYNINPASEESLRDLLYERLRMPRNYFTAGGSKDDWDEGNRLPAVHELALKDMLHHVGGSPLIEALLKWRTVAKIASTYTLPMIERTDSRGYLHGVFDQVGARTGRLSSKKPNLQNIPSDDDAGIRRAFIVPKGKRRVILDFSQIELRVLAFLAKEPGMTQAFIDGEDVHGANSKRMFGNADKENRRMIKVLGFGTAYGMTKFGIRDNLNKNADPSRGIPFVTEDQAGEMLEQWHGRTPRVRRYTAELVMDMKRTRPPSFTNSFGRTRRISTIFAFGSVGRRAARQAVASIVQGTAAELTKVSLLRAQDVLDQARAEGRWEGEIVSTIHDEIQIDVDDHGALECAKLCRTEMERFPEFLPIPIVVDGEWTDTNWAEKVDIPWEQ